MAEEGDDYYQDGYEEDQQQYQVATKKLGNNLTSWGNSRTMNLNHLLLTNVQNSPYFKVRLFQLKTYHEVVDEIYYKVDHLEPWERGTRKTAGQTGMCGGVRGVGAGGVVSTSFCILYKLFTLKLTRKQLNGLLNHCDSPFIRGLGIMYVRFTQPPQDLWSWYEEFLDDEEELDVKAGGGCVMTIGTMVKTVLTKLEWFSTLFPRIPVPIEKQIDANLQKYQASKGPAYGNNNSQQYDQHQHESGNNSNGAYRGSSSRLSTPNARGSSRERRRTKRSRSPRHSRKRSRSRERRDSKKKSRRRSGSRDDDRSKRSRSPTRRHHHHHKHRRDERRHRSRSRDRSYRSSR